MNSIPVFDYARFRLLTHSDLYAYMEPLVISPNTQVPVDALERMRSELAQYDEYHLVYALQLGCDHWPEAFLPYLPTYLTHELGSVWSTAFRILDRLPHTYITQELVDSIHKAYLSDPTKKHVADILHRLRARLYNNSTGAEGKAPGARGC